MSVSHHEKKVAEQSPTSLALEKWIRGGIYLLLALLPFHAFLITALGRALGLTTADAIHPAFTAIQLWKELVIAFLIILVIIRSIIDRKIHIKFLSIDIFVLGLGVLALLHLPVKTGWYASWIMGLRTDAEFLLPWFIARSIPWNYPDIKKVIKIIFGSGGIVLILGILHGLMPERILTLLGYSPYVSSWVPGKPLPLFHALAEGGARRWMSSLAGPNQYAAYLLIILGLGIGMLLTKKVRLEAAKPIKTMPLWFALGLIVLSLIMAGSRAAELGAIAIVMLTFFMMIKSNMQKIIVAGSIALLALGSISLAAFVSPTFFSDHVIRYGSTNDHIVKFREGLDVIAKHPAGLGLGQAGPVSVRNRPIETGGDGGLVSESWYLQIGQELGIAGLALMLALLFSLLQLCFSLARATRDPDLRGLAMGTGLAAAGIFIQAIFLHTFADNIVVSLTLWILFGIITERTTCFIAPTNTLQSKALHALEKLSQKTNSKSKHSD